MKIQSIVYFNNPFKLRESRNSLKDNNFSSTFSNGRLSSDVVSFSAKKYDIDSISNPTNHCAYCGCKVYNETQIEALAKGMMQGKSHRLQGDIKSVLEKLESAVRSDELTFAKRLENSEEIDFFKKFLQIATDKSFLKGEAIFEQVYSLNSDDAIETLKRNMRPLSRTIDHVSPQNLDEDNNNSDVNLVEACYCCNHDLKKGVTFAEFYAMFPSIKENMPSDKFHYAYSELMSSSASSILNRMSASNLLKHIQRLFGQRQEAITRVGSIDFRILEANASVDSSIKTCEEEIALKQNQKKEFEERLEAILNDDEYKALIKRIQLLQEVDKIDTVIASLRERKKNASDALNELRTPSKKQKKQSKTEMSKDEKEAKIFSLKETIKSLSEEIEASQHSRDDFELEIMELDARFPTIEILQTEKNKADNLANAHIQLTKETVNLEKLQSDYQAFEMQLNDLSSKIETYPKEDFSVSVYTDEQAQQYNRYMQLVEAAEYIETHSTGFSMKTIINLAAKQSITDDISALETSLPVQDYKKFIERKELQSQFDALTKKKNETWNQIKALEKQISHLRKVTAHKTLAQAQSDSQRLASDIRRINDKQNHLNLPKTIATLKAEIMLLQKTIDELKAKQLEIQNLSTPAS